MNNNQHSFEGKNIVTGYDKKIIIDGVDITIPSNKISVIIGSNGCGKSTLLKTLARLIALILISSGIFIVQKGGGKTDQ